MTTVTRQLIQDVYVRICQDAGFKMDKIQVAVLTSKMLNISPLEVWTTLGLPNMEKLADGSHGFYKLKEK